eukprot:c5925_g1_i2.p1 GENE.c5925_g1_i2~~c5925_g1_i2.p1  ORF type:complete len:333 (-),score=36.41 c5925_g1_i2:82-1056(-)
MTDTIHPIWESRFWPLILVCAILGMLGSLYIIFSFAILKKFRRSPFTMVFCAGCCDLLSIIGMFISSPTNKDLCQLAGSWRNYFPLANYCWTTAVAVTMFLMTTSNHVSDHRSKVRFTIATHLACWLIPLAFTLPPALSHSFVLLDYQWCWISSKKPLYRWLCFYLLLFILLCIDIYIFIRLMILNRRNRNTTSEIFPAPERQHNSPAGAMDAVAPGNTRVLFDTRKRIQRVVQMYIVVFVFSRMWSVGNRVDNQVNGKSSEFWRVTHACFSLLQGFFDAIVFGTSPTLLQEYELLVASLTQRFRRTNMTLAANVSRRARLELN